MIASAKTRFNNILSAWDKIGSKFSLGSKTNIAQSRLSLKLYFTSYLVINGLRIVFSGRVYSSLTLKGFVAHWLETCGWKPKVPDSSPAASYV